MKGSHNLSVVNAEWFRTADGIPYDPDFNAIRMIHAYGDKKVQFVAHLNAAIRHIEAIAKVWEEGVYCLKLSRLMTEYHSIYLKMPTDMSKPKKYYYVRCTHMKEDQAVGIDAPKIHCAKMKHRCLRFFHRTGRTL